VEEQQVYIKVLDQVDLEDQAEEDLAMQVLQEVLEQLTQAVEAVEQVALVEQGGLEVVVSLL
jgi:nucleoid DNA-binding protein